MSPTHKNNLNSSLTNSTAQRFTFEYFCERLNSNNYKDICRRREELEIRREEFIMKSNAVEFVFSTSIEQN